MVMTQTLRKISQEERKKLLKLLTYEKVRGKPIYYRDYEKVLRGELPPEAVMGSSELHALLVALIVAFLKEKLGKDFAVTAGELGFIYAPRSFRSLDIAIFKKQDLLNPTDKYTKKVPLVVIEIDTKADLSKYGSFEEYMYEKTQDLLNAGVQKVIWFTTKVKKITEAEKGKNWVVKDWNQEVEVIKGVKLNLAKLLEEEGIKI